MLQNNLLMLCQSGLVNYTEKPFVQGFFDPKPMPNQAKEAMNDVLLSYKGGYQSFMIFRQGAWANNYAR